MFKFLIVYKKKGVVSLTSVFNFGFELVIRSLSQKTSSTKDLLVLMSLFEIIDVSYQRNILVWAFSSVEIAQFHFYSVSLSSIFL